MINELAFKENRKIKNVFLYNFLSRLFFLYWRLVTYWTYGSKDMFSEINIETTSLCNRMCPYCPVSNYNRGNYKLSEKIFKKIINELLKIKFNGKIYHHFYAEPLMDKRLEKFVKYEKSLLKKNKIYIYSNGDLLTKKRFYSLINAGVDKFFITLHEKGNKTFLGFYSSLNNKAKKRIVIRHISSDSLLTNRGGLVKVKNKEVKLFCGYPSSNLVINVHGKVVLCCEDYFGHYSFGDIHNESIMQIWNKPAFKKTREDILKGKFSYPICKICNSRN